MEWGKVTDGFEDVKAELEARRAERLAQDTEKDEANATIRQERDIVKRAKKLFSAQAINFKDVKLVKSGNGFVTQALMTDENKKVVLDALFDGEVDKPHRDHFKGRIVDHDDRIIDEFYPAFRWVEAFSAGGLKGVPVKVARDVVKEWALANERNDLIEHVKRTIPKWDKTPRMRTKLIDIFREVNTPENQNCSQYFWLSLYARVRYPGSLAPMMLSIFGPQGCGKSLFAKRLCQIITGNTAADSVQFNLDEERLSFLRKITGFSIIASVGEMSGFTRADLNKVKDAITRQSDLMDYKYEGTFNQQRQFIIVMDGNKLDGLFRDETGERRIIMWLCGRQEDEQGKLSYDPRFMVAQNHWDSLEEEVWQIMAECDEWWGENGEKKYNTFVQEVVQQVNATNEKVKAKGNGVISDPVVDTFFTTALAATPMVYRKTGVACSIPGTEKKTEFYAVPQGVIVYADTFIRTMDRVAGKQKVTSERTKAALFAFAELNGGIVGKFTGKRPGVLFCVGKDETPVRKRGGRPEAVDQLASDDGFNSALVDAEAIKALKTKFTGDDGSMVDEELAEDNEM